MKGMKLLILIFKVIPLLLIPLILIASCQNEMQNTELTTFKKPILKKSMPDDTNYYKKQNYINSINPKLLGKFRFSDSIEIDQTLSKLSGKTLISTHMISHSDTNSIDGFEIETDYLSNIFNDGSYSYPVYLINQTPGIKTIYGDQGYMFGLQEAIDSSGDWRPIEGRAKIDFEPWYFDLKVHSKEFVVILFPKYSGKYKTKLRVRIRNGDATYISKPFEGSINYNQFYLKPSGEFHNRLKEYESLTIQYTFYGSFPYQVDIKNGGLKYVK